MKIIFSLIISTFLFSNSTFCQNSRKLEKYLIVTTVDSFDSTYPIYFERKNPNKHAWETVSNYFKKAFTSYGFTVLNAMPNETERSSKYIIILDYVYEYAIARYKWQHSNLTGQIVDMNNPSIIIGTINYDGKYNPSELSEGIAARLKSITRKIHISNSNSKKTKTQVKSKEERLQELKGFFEKELITKEEYEAEKKKILSE